MMIKKRLIVPIYFESKIPVNKKIVQEQVPNLIIRCLEESTPTTDTTQMSTPSDRRTILKRLGLEYELKKSQ